MILQIILTVAIYTMHTHTHWIKTSSWNGVLHFLFFLYLPSNLFQFEAPESHNFYYSQQSIFHKTACISTSASLYGFLVGILPGILMSLLLVRTPQNLKRMCGGGATRNTAKQNNLCIKNTYIYSLTNVVTNPSNSLRRKRPGVGESLNVTKVRITNKISTSWRTEINFR